MDLCHPDSLVQLVMNRFIWKSLAHEDVFLLQVTNAQDIFSCLQCWNHENRFIDPNPDPSPDCL